MKTSQDHQHQQRETAAREARERAQQNADRVERELAEARTVTALKSKFLDNFFAAKEAQLWEAFGQVKIGDADALIHIHHQYKSLNALRAEVLTVTNTGKLAQAEKEARPTAEH